MFAAAFQTVAANSPHEIDLISMTARPVDPGIIKWHLIRVSLARKPQQRRKRMYVERMRTTDLQDCHDTNNRAMKMFLHGKLAVIAHKKQPVMGLLAVYS